MSAGKVLDDTRSRMFTADTLKLSVMTTVCEGLRCRTLRKENLTLLTYRVHGFTVWSMQVFMEIEG